MQKLPLTDDEFRNFITENPETILGVLPVVVSLAKVAEDIPSCKDTVDRIFWLFKNYPAMQDELTSLRQEKEKYLNQVISQGLELERLRRELKDKQ